MGESFNGRTSISKIEYGSSILSSPAISESSSDRTPPFEGGYGGLNPSSETIFLDRTSSCNEIYKLV